MEFSKNQMGCDILGDSNHFLKACANQNFKHTCSAEYIYFKDQIRHLKKFLKFKCLR